MAWIGIRDEAEAGFAAAGLPSAGRLPPLCAPETGLLARGTLLIETEANDGSDRILLCHDRRDACPGSLILVQLSDGTIALRMRQGEERRQITLHGESHPAEGPLRIAYTWDAPRRRASLSAFAPATGSFRHVLHEAPIPLPLRDAAAIFDPRAHVGVIGEGVIFAALSNRVEPVGPMPALSGHARVMTPKGMRHIAALEPGDVISTFDGQRARVHWCGPIELPARGCFAPLRLRAPYFGLERDLFVAHDARLMLSGSEVEYLFGEECVLATARHLRNSASVIPVQGLHTVTYHHLILDRHAVMNVSGAAIESLDLGPMLEQGEVLRQSVMNGFAAARRPRPCARPHPVLRDFEALTLAALRAA